MFGSCLAWVVYAMVNEVNIGYKITMLLSNGPGLILSIYLNLCACKLQYQDYMSGKLKEEFVKFLYEQGNTASLSIQQQQCGDSKSISDEITTTRHNNNTSFIKSQKFSHLIPLVANLSVNDAISPANHEISVVIMSAFWLIVITCLVFIPMTAHTRTRIVAIIGNMLLVFFYAAPLSTIMTVLRTRSSATIHVPTMLLNTANSSFWFVYTLFQNDPWQYVANGIGSVVGLVQIVLACIFPNKYIEDDDFSDQSELFDEESELLSKDCDGDNFDDSFLIGNTFGLHKLRRSNKENTTNTQLMLSAITLDDHIDSSKIELPPQSLNLPVVEENGSGEQIDETNDNTMCKKEEEQTNNINNNEKKNKSSQNIKENYIIEPEKENIFTIINGFFCA